MLHANSEGAFAVGSGNGIINMPFSTFNNRLDWTASTGKVTVYYNPSSYTSPTNFTSQPSSGNFSLASAKLKLTAYMLVNSKTELQSISTNLNEKLRSVTRTSMRAVARSIQSEIFPTVSTEGLKGSDTRSTT